MLILCIVATAMAAFGYRINRRYDHPICLFCGLWAFILFLFSIQLFQTIPLSASTEAIMWTMILSFFFGSICHSTIRQYRRQSGPIRCEFAETDVDKVVLNVPVFWVLCCITIAVMLRDELQIILKLFNGYSFVDITQEAGGKITVAFSGSFDVFLYMFIVHPFSVCVHPICAIEYFSDKKKWPYLAVDLVIVALNVVHHGGRNSIVVFVLCYMLAFTMLGKKVVLTKRQKKGIAILFVCAAILILVISGSRGIEDIWLSFYAYLICAIPLCTIYLGFPFVMTHTTYGFLSFKGIFYPLNTILGKLGLSLPTAYADSTVVYRIIEDNYVRIGDYRSTGTNAFIPAGAYFYIDDGIVFELICMFLYGAGATYLYDQARIRRDKKSVALYVMFGYALLLSFTRLYFSSYQHMIGLLYIALVVYRKPRRK